MEKSNKRIFKFVFLLLLAFLSIIAVGCGNKSNGIYILLLVVFYPLFGLLRRGKVAFIKQDHPAFLLPGRRLREY